MRIIVLLALFCLGLFAVDMNKATLNELKELNGIGAKKAEMIIKYRSEHKCFKNKEDLLNVKGIGQGFLQKNEGQLTFSACK